MNFIDNMTDKRMTQQQRSRFSEALKRLADDDELLIAMGAIVLDDAPAVMDNLRKQVAENQLSEAASTAHKLKGLLSTFDTGDAVASAQQVIAAAKAGNQSECQASWSKCDQDATRLLSEVREIVDPIST